MINKTANKIFLAAFALLLPMQALALSAQDRHSLLNTSEYYWDAQTDSELGACSDSGENIPSSVELNQSTIDGINKMKSLYVQIAQEEKMPWQMLAAIDFEEAGNDPNKSMLDGQPLGQKALDSGNVPTTKEQSIRDGVSILRSHLKDIYGVTLSPTMTDIQVKEGFISYNRGQTYKVAGLPPDASPYVMNQYDAAHHDMVFPNIPGETLAGMTWTIYGTFTIYSKIANITGGSCSGVGDGTIVGIAKSQIGTKEDPPGCNCGGPVKPDGHTVASYTDGNAEPWCADFVSWVYNKAGRPFTGGVSGGWRIPGAGNIANWMQANGVWFLNGPNANPQPGQIVYFNWDGTGQIIHGGDDHVGIVDHVEGTTLYTIEGNASVSVTANSYPNFRSNPDIVGFGGLK